MLLNISILFRFLPAYFRTFINEAVDLPSYQPSNFLVPETLPMTFTERVKNTLIYTVLNRDVSWDIRVFHKLDNANIGFFPVVKHLMPILALLPMLCVCEKLDYFTTIQNILYSHS